LTKSQYELFKKYDHFGEIEYVELSNYAKGNGIIFMSTPFDNEAVEYLNELMPVFKIASADITNFPLIERIAKKKKPIILSVGAATIEEIREAVSVIEHSGNHEIIIMHCVLNYPTQYQNANLLVIQHLQKIFPKYLIGYSDHTAPDPQMLVLVSAYVLGARVIEKHFTLDKGLAGNDHYHAMDTQDLTNALINLKFAKMILGNKEKTIQDELTARKYARRSIVAAIDITKGTKITQDMLICKRPGTGISPKLENSVIGKTAKINIKVDEILSWEQIE
jgi:N-acetylneuraminate synthase